MGYLIILLESLRAPNHSTSTLHLGRIATLFNAGTILPPTQPYGCLSGIPGSLDAACLGRSSVTARVVISAHGPQPLNYVQTSLPTAHTVSPALATPCPFPWTSGASLLRMIPAWCNVVNCEWPPKTRYALVMPNHEEWPTVR